MKPFKELHLAFVNFSENTTEEQKDMQEMKDLTVMNEGKVVEWNDEKCTHIIIDAIPGLFIELPVDLTTVKDNVYLVYKEWFWASIQIACRADETIKDHHEYPLADHQRTRVNTNISISILSDSRNLSCEILSPTLDFSTDSILDSGFNESKTAIENNIDYKSFSKRRKICLELLDTEKNYLEILRVIVNIFYKPLEEPTTDKQYLLDNTERKIIFGNLPPILEIHEGIYSDLERTIENWKENCSIGDVFIKYVSCFNKLKKKFYQFIFSSSFLFFSP